MTGEQETKQEQKWVDLNLMFPDGGNEIVPIEKEVFLKICETAYREEKTVENKFLEILQEIIDKEFEEQKEQKEQ